ncbi:hypothetical protein O0Q50_20080 [Priestia aryabhattai]|uniref:Uncharacterized protein n=1 Tax=Priestia aryabhattai TaxID=412384 RepID=A0AAX6NCF8_PRIAR|nr:hypothetical protein [Priestia aryabhattai]MDU9693477.1 hypothetical protein [Priestia aryabhattai]
MNFGKAFASLRGGKGDSILEIDWNEIKIRILMRFVTEFPFLKITGLLNFDFNKYICSRHLAIEVDDKNTAKKIEDALKKAFKNIGMKVDISMFFRTKKLIIEEMRELLFTPTLTFNLEEGLDFSIQNSDLCNLNRVQIIKCIERMQMHVFEGYKKNNVPIDVLFGDEKYIRNKLYELRGSDVVQGKIDELECCINYNRIKQMSEKMKKYYEKCIQEETRKYLLEHNIRVTREVEL